MWKVLRENTGQNCSYAKCLSSIRPKCSKVLGAGCVAGCSRWSQLGVWDNLSFVGEAGGGGVGGFLLVWRRQLYCCWWSMALTQGVLGGLVAGLATPLFQGMWLSPLPLPNISTSSAHSFRNKEGFPRSRWNTSSLCLSLSWGGFWGRDPAEQPCRGWRPPETGASLSFRAGTAGNLPPGAQLGVKIQTACSRWVYFPAKSRMEQLFCPVAALCTWGQNTKASLFPPVCVCVFFHPQLYLP